MSRVTVTRTLVGSWLCPDELLTRADIALYEAKRVGRDRAAEAA